MNREEVIRMAREAGMEANEAPKAVKALGHSVPLLWLERFAALVAAEEREKRKAYEMMAECMDMVRQELIQAGVISKEVPPMMVADAVMVAVRNEVAAERDACAKACEARYMGDNNREDMEAKACAAAIRARDVQPKG